MASVGHFGCPTFTFDRISVHFRSIKNLFLNFEQNGRRRPFWMCEIRSQFWPFHIDTVLLYFFTFWQNFHRRSFWMSEITFDRISGHFRSIRNFLYFWNVWQNGRFGCPKITFDRISGHFRSIRNSFLSAAILDVPNYFRSHFWPFQIDRPFWMFENHFSSHFWTFHIDTEPTRSAYSFGHGEAYMLYINILISWWCYGSTHVSCIIRTKFNFNIRSPTHKPPNTTSNVMITFVQNMK